MIGKISNAVVKLLNILLQQQGNKPQAVVPVAIVCKAPHHAGRHKQ